jgi:hypothetical protein
MPGMPERRTHDYLRHGVTSLFAAFNIADGTVVSALHRRHRAIEFKKFLITIDKAVPAELDVHLVCDNCENRGVPQGPEPDPCDNWPQVPWCGSVGFRSPAVSAAAGPVSVSR